MVTAVSEWCFWWRSKEGFAFIYFGHSLGRGVHQTDADCHQTPGPAVKHSLVSCSKTWVFSFNEKYPVCVGYHKAHSWDFTGQHISAASSDYGRGKEILQYLLQPGNVFTGCWLVSQFTLWFYLLLNICTCSEMKWFEMYCGKRCILSCKCVKRNVVGNVMDYFK